MSTSNDSENNSCPISVPVTFVGIVEEEERDRQVIGLTAANKCLVLARMVDNAMAERGGVTEEAAIQHLLSTGTYMQGWCPGHIWHDKKS